MTDRQFVRSKYPKAELHFYPELAVDYGIPTKVLRGSGRDWYYVRTEYLGDKIGKGGSTPLRAWKQAKIAIKEIEIK